MTARVKFIKKKAPMKTRRKKYKITNSLNAVLRKVYI